MGYSTDFSGSLELSRPATLEEKTFLDALAETRRMKRDTAVLMQFYNGEDGYPFAKDKTNPDEVYGFLGEYYVGSVNNVSILDNNAASGEVSFLQRTQHANIEDTRVGVLKQPSLWLQWVLNSDGTLLEWDGGEKFYSYVEWLEYLIQHFFEPWGIKLNGSIEWRGEEDCDIGLIEVCDNDVTTKLGTIHYE